MIELLEQIKKTLLLSYRVEVKKLHKEEFSRLNLVDQKQLLIDQNNLYVNYSDIDDIDDVDNNVT